MIRVEKADEVYLLLIADYQSLEYTDDIKNIQKISNYFSAYAEGFQHSYLYMSGKWDGIIRFAKRIKNGTYTFPIGLMDNLLNFAEINNIPLDIRFKMEDIYAMHEVNWTSLNPILNTPTYFEERDYQKQYVDEFFKLGRACIVSPTGSGKSSIIYRIVQNLIHFCLNPEERILIVVPTVDLIKQMYDEFIENGFQKIDEYVHLLSAGAEKNFNNLITISTWQSIQNLKQDDFKPIGALIVDECHGVSSSAEKLSYIAHCCMNARFRLGTTGTTPDKKIDELNMVSYLGPILKFTSTKKLIEDGYLTQFVIKSIILKWKSRNSFNINDFQEEYDAITECKERNEIIIDLCKKLSIKNNETSIIVLGRRVEHLKELCEIMQKRYPQIKSYLVTGKDTKKKDRVEIYDDLRKTGGLFFATEKIAGTGLNIKNISHIILATPLKSKVIVLQAIGRGVRKHNKKQVLEVYDFIDKIPLKSKKVNSTYRWIQKKEYIYSSECFTNKFYNLNLQII